MIKLEESHKHYNLLWDIKQMKDGREPIDIEKVFINIQNIIKEYDATVFELEKNHFDETFDLQDYLIVGVEKLGERLKKAYDMGLSEEIFGTYVYPLNRRLLIDFDYSYNMNLYMGEEWEERINNCIFRNNWEEILLSMKEKKNSEIELKKEKELKEQEEKEYNLYLELKKKFDNK